MKCIWQFGFKLKLSQNRQNLNLNFSLKLSCRKKNCWWNELHHWPQFKLQRYPRVVPLTHGDVIQGAKYYCLADFDKLTLTCCLYFGQMPILLKKEATLKKFLTIIVLKSKPKYAARLLISLRLRQYSWLDIKREELLTSYTGTS